MPCKLRPSAAIAISVSGATTVAVTKARIKTEAGHVLISLKVDNLTFNASAPIKQLFHHKADAQKLMSPTGKSLYRKLDDGSRLIRNLLAKTLL